MKKVFLAAFILISMGVSAFAVTSLAGDELNEASRESSTMNEKRLTLFDQGTKTLLPPYDNEKKEVGRYQIFSTEQAVLLLDTRTGLTYRYFTEEINGEKQTGWQPLMFYTSGNAK